MAVGSQGDCTMRVIPQQHPDSHCDRSMKQVAAIMSCSVSEGSSALCPDVRVTGIEVVETADGKLRKSNAGDLSVSTQ